MIQLICIYESTTIYKGQFTTIRQIQDLILGCQFSKDFLVLFCFEISKANNKEAFFIQNNFLFPKILKQINFTYFFFIYCLVVENINLCNIKLLELMDDQILLFIKIIQIAYMLDLDYKINFLSIIQIKNKHDKISFLFIHIINFRIIMLLFQVSY